MSEPTREQARQLNERALNLIGKVMEKHTLAVLQGVWEELDTRDKQYLSAVKGRQDFRRAFKDQRAEVAALRARVAELEAANTGLATEAQRLKAGLRFYARGLHFSPGDAICWDDVSGEPPNFLCDEYGTTIEDGTIAKDVLLGRDAAWSGEDWPPEELPEEIGLPPNKPPQRIEGE